MIQTLKGDITMKIYKTIGEESNIRIIEEKVDKGVFISADVVEDYDWVFRITNRSYIETAASEHF